MLNLLTESYQEQDHETCTNLKKPPPYGRGLNIPALRLSEYTGKNSLSFFQWNEPLSQLCFSDIYNMYMWVMAH